jgi:hypothetical protein
MTSEVFLEHVSPSSNTARLDWQAAASIYLELLDSIFRVNESFLFTLVTAETHVDRTDPNALRNRCVYGVGHAAFDKLLRNFEVMIDQMKQPLYDLPGSGKHSSRPTERIC